MSDPNALPDHPKTRRADPIQPDKPVGNTSPDRPTTGQKDTAETPAGTQSEQALKNVREGYCGPKR